MKKIAGIILLSAFAFGLYQIIGTGSTLEGDDGDRKSSRWQSAQRSRSKSKNKINDSNPHKSGDENSDKKAKAGKKGKSQSPSQLENPFSKSTATSEPPTWEEAKNFAFRPINFKPQNEQEKSLLQMGRYMAATYLVPNSHEKLISLYESSGVTPDISQNSNPHTGKMLAVRTQKSLSGTRYPHSQYFSNENNEMMMQHTSVEYRPGPNAFERVNEMVKELYQVKEGKVTRNGNFIKYKLGHGQNLWVQKMTAQDLKNSPLNAYEDSDIGTIRMAIEQEIHFEEDGVDPHMAPGDHSH